MKRITIEVDDELKKQVNLHCAKLDKKVKDWLTDLIKKEISE